MSWTDSRFREELKRSSSLLTPRSEIPRIVQVYDAWAALHPQFKPFPWPQTEEEDAAYAEEIRSEYPHSRLIMEHARGRYLDIAEKHAWNPEDEMY